MQSLYIFFFFLKSKLALSKLLSDGTIRKKMIVTKVESGRWKVENKCNVHRDRYFLVDYILFWSYFGDEAIKFNKSQSGWSNHDCDEKSTNT